MARGAKERSWTGVGIYTIPEAARLVGKSPATIRRWLLGYSFPTKSGEGGESPPIIRPQLPQLEAHWAIGFLDLVELLFVKAFLKQGVSLQTVRRAAKEAARRWDAPHPFCLRRFATDGRTIFATIQDEAGKGALLELTRSQLCFTEVLSPYLRQLDYDRLGDVSRWWPLGKDTPVIVDPSISFGKPVVARYNIPTEALLAAVQADQAEREVAEWFDVPAEVVRAAVSFERSLAA